MCLFWCTHFVFLQGKISTLLQQEETYTQTVNQMIKKVHKLSSKLYFKVELLNC